MNNPSPSLSQLIAEAEADRLLAEHRSATEAYAELVRRFQEDLNRIDFPLGSPSKFYDVKDITDFLNDSLQPNDAEWLEQAAMDFAKETV